MPGRATRSFIGSLHALASQLSLPVFSSFIRRRSTIWQIVSIVCSRFVSWTWIDGLSYRPPAYLTYASSALAGQSLSRTLIPLCRLHTPKIHPDQNALAPTCRKCDGNDLSPVCPGTISQPKFPLGRNTDCLYCCPACTYPGCALLVWSSYSCAIQVRWRDHTGKREGIGEEWGFGRAVD